MTAVGAFPEGNFYLMFRLSDTQDLQKSSSVDLLLCEYYKDKVDLRPYYRPMEQEISYPLRTKRQHYPRFNTTPSRINYQYQSH